MNWWEIFALITGVVYIVFEIRQKNFMWVVGIDTSLASMWVFFRQGLYASFGLNTYYFITAFIGLWQWARYKRQVAGDVSTSLDMTEGAVDMTEGAVGMTSGSQGMTSGGKGERNCESAAVKGDDVVVLNRLKWPAVAVSAAVCVAGTFILSSGMDYLHGKGLLAENPMSLLDSAATMLSVVATWWLIKAYIQQWWLWIIADLLSVILCVTQQMWWMAALYLAYVISAVIGLHYWNTRGVYLSDTQ